MKPGKTISSETVFEGRAVTVRIDTIRKRNGEETIREIVEHSQCIAVVAVDADHNVILEKQYREAIEEVLLEIPAGGIEKGETPAAAVRRELREETGLFPKKIKRLTGYYLAPGYSTEYLYLYLATDLVPRPLKAEDTDEIELVRVPVDDIPALLKSGKVRDGKSVAGLYTFLAYLKDNPLT